VTKANNTMRIVLTYGHELLREVRIEKPVVLVGRDPACDIAVDDITVSKRHMKLEYVDGELHVEDLESTNGLKVNGHSVKRQALQHLDVIQIGSHRMHVFDDEMMPSVQMGPESTVQTATRRPREPAREEAPRIPLADTQPTETPVVAPLLGLKRVGDGSTVQRLDQPNNMIGASGQSAVLAWRRDTLYLSRLTRDTLRVNGRDVGAGSSQIRAGDVIEVGDARYLVVTVER
jgi:predicted component of type VI protein secretion system